MNFNPFPKPDSNFDHSSSSSSFLCHDFFRVDRAGCYDHLRFFHAQRQPDDKLAVHEISSKTDNNLKLTLWKKEDQGAKDQTTPEKTDKGMVSSEIKNPTNRVGGSLNITTPDQESRSLETDGFSSSNNSISSHSSPIRVCTDCNTTKTPLWRSGPMGPKSLCNACGIRQRKARRAMAAAAAAGTNQPTNSKLLQHKEKTRRSGHQYGHSLQVKKRCKTSSVGGGSQRPRNNNNVEKKVCSFEDLLINLSKKLGIHRVFPEEEKDAAILLMALSYGLVHG